MPEFLPFLPEAILATAGFAVLAAGARRRTLGVGRVVAIAIAVIGVAAVSVVVTARLSDGVRVVPGGVVAADGLAVLFQLLILAASAIVLLMAAAPLTRTDIDGGELVGMVLVADLGAFILVSSTNLVTVFAGLELLTMAIIVIVGCIPRRSRSVEAAVKVFVTSAVFSAVLLYGISVIYGTVGSVDFETIRIHLGGIPSRNSMLGLGIALTAFGVLFKVAAVPFHPWLPDAVEGSPTPAAAFVSVVPVVASFAVLLRLFSGAFMGVTVQWVAMLWVVSATAMIFGSLAALTQETAKRFLAYSSIAHGGTALMGLAAASESGARAAIVYMVALTFMNLGAFGIVMLLESELRRELRLTDFRALGRRSPLAAGGMLVFLAALSGLPLTVGFVGRLAVWAAAVEAGAIGLVAISVVALLIGLAAYSRIVVQMVIGNGDGVNISASVFDPWTVTAVVACAVVVIGLGVWPAPVLGWADAALAALVRL